MLNAQPSAHVAVFTTGLLQLFWNGSDEGCETRSFVEFKKAQHVYNNRVYQDENSGINSPLKQP